MNLLIVCQAIDTNHPNLEFFVRWVEEFAKHHERVTVIANEVGAHSLPANVAVYSLGKEKQEGRRMRYARFLSLVTDLSANYDTVFCHMNPEFVLAGAPWWLLKRKRVVLWYVHGTVSWRLRAALLFVHAALTASSESLRIRSHKVHVVGHGIDTDFFTPDASVERGEHILSAGRLMKSKRHGLAIQRAVAEGRALRIAGVGPERGELERLAYASGADVVFLGGLTQRELRDEYRRAAYLFHASLTGSVDKVVLEAMAVGTPVVTTSEVFKDYPLANGAAYIREHHSLQALIPKISAYLGGKI